MIEDELRKIQSPGCSRDLCLSKCAVSSRCKVVSKKASWNGSERHKGWGIGNALGKTIMGI